MPRVVVQYYAALREQRGISQETVETEATTLLELYADLQQAHGLRLAQNILKVAVNDAFANWDAPIRDGDRVVFIPPVAGG